MRIIPSIRKVEFFCCYDKYLRKNNLEEGIICLGTGFQRLQSISLGLLILGMGGALL
jgi:hypothetical protein